MDCPPTPTPALRRLRHASHAILLGGCLLFAGAALAATDLEQARKLMAAGKAKQAYHLLAPELSRHAGEPDYDYLLGIAALDSGHPTEAVFAFERVLSVRPDHAQARAELARAYFLLNENDAAQATFKQVLNEDNPPPAARRTIERYLNTIDQRFAATRDHFSAYIEFGAGHDSNVNSATADETVAIPALNNQSFTLNSDGTEKADTVGRLHTGLLYSRPLGTHLRLFLGGSLRARRNLSEYHFNNDTLDLFGGLKIQQGREQFTFTAQGQRFWLDNSRNREIRGLGVQWQHTLDARNQVTLFTRFSKIRYRDQAVRDVDENTRGLAWAHAFDASGTPILYLGGYAGEDNNIETRRDYYGRRFEGVRIGGEYTLGERSSIDTAFNFQHSRYRGADPLFQTKREDRLYDWSVGLNRRLDGHWTLRPEYHYTENDANITLNRFHRWQLLLNLRRDFR